MSLHTGSVPACKNTWRLFQNKWRLFQNKRRLFFKKWRVLGISGGYWGRLSLLQCCSCCSSREGMSIPHKFLYIYIYIDIYINIGIIFDFSITYFGTATLQQLQHSGKKTRPTNLTIRPEVSGIHRCKGNTIISTCQTKSIKICVKSKLNHNYLPKFL